MVRARAGTLHEVTACTDVVILYGNVCPAWSGCVFTNSVRTVANGVRTSPNNVRTVYELSTNSVRTLFGLLFEVVQHRVLRVVVCIDHIG